VTEKCIKALVPQVPISELKSILVAQYKNPLQMQRVLLESLIHLIEQTIAK
jgi:hypothetical protein